MEKSGLKGHKFATMKFRFLFSYLFILILLFSFGCRQAQPIQKRPGTALQHYCMAQLRDVIVHDIFNPPVASRIYAYSSLAYYEALRPAHPSANSFTEKMHGFDKIQSNAVSAETDFRLSAAWAFLQVSRKLVFSKDSLADAEQEIKKEFEHLEKNIFQRSINWGETVAEMILQRASSDNYAKTRSMPRYSAFSEKGVWKQTPPDYADATEPHWRLIKPLRMDSASQCKPPVAPKYSLEKSSQYFKELNEVLQLSQQLTGEMDTIARYWDDNPFVTEHVGHLAYGNKKMTPPGHWMSIVEILCLKTKADEYTTAKAYALTASAMFDGFISCWDEKFRSITSRPITVIREEISPKWNSRLQTPPFPEYTSGHSVISAAAASVLTTIFGKGFAFHDNSEIPYLGLERSFPSIDSASNEAGISRLYGGIHFRSAIENGKLQGQNVGVLFNSMAK
jgi:hypothetical protein